MSKNIKGPWTQQDPNLVKGLILQADTEMPNYWLQVYDYGHSHCFIACIYGISVNGIFELMGNEWCDSIESAKASAELQWNDFRKRSRLYKKRGVK